MFTNQQAMPILHLSSRKYQKPQVEIQNVMATTDLDLKIQQAMLAH
jgi:TATA-box binding protein (TBP) (component of TFIID and TFIIIB)